MEEAYCWCSSCCVHWGMTSRQNLVDSHGGKMAGWPGGNVLASHGVTIYDCVPFSTQRLG